MNLEVKYRSPIRDDLTGLVTNAFYFCILLFLIRKILGLLGQLETHDDQLVHCPKTRTPSCFALLEDRTPQVVKRETIENWVSDYTYYWMIRVWRWGEWRWDGRGRWSGRRRGWGRRSCLCPSTATHGQDQQQKLNEPAKQVGTLWWQMLQIELLRKKLCMIFYWHSLSLSRRANL